MAYTKPVHTACGETISRAVARAAQHLDDEARERIATFIRGRLSPEGGFRGRRGQTDLYYTVFGIESCRALGLELPRPEIARYLERFVGNDTLDFVHLTCLARCAARIPPSNWKPDGQAWLSKTLRTYQTERGGFNRQPGSVQPVIYDCFLGLLACEGVGQEYPSRAAFLKALSEARTQDGSYINDPELRTASTPVTAAGAVLEHELTGSVTPATVEWLLARQSRLGGFVAGEDVPMPDLLSTATSLHALGLAGAVGRAQGMACLDFISTLWDDSGGFCGYPLDPTPDCEYTFYGLLALNYLASDSTSSNS